MSQKQQENKNIQKICDLVNKVIELSNSFEIGTINAFTGFYLLAPENLEEMLKSKEIEENEEALNLPFPVWIIHYKNTNKVNSVALTIKLPIEVSKITTLSENISYTFDCLLDTDHTSIEIELVINDTDSSTVQYSTVLEAFKSLVFEADRVYKLYIIPDIEEKEKAEEKNN